MSMRSTFIYGYGFPTASIYGQHLLRFIANHRDTVKKIWGDDGDAVVETIDKIDIESIDAIKDSGILELEELYDEYADLWDALNAIADDDIAVTEGYDIIASIITTETGVVFDYERAQSDECIGDPAILLEERLPWEYNDVEKALTEDSLIDILKVYAAELNVNMNDIGFIEIEYYG